MANLVSLTPEERRRIYEEEKARLQAEEHAKAEIGAERAKPKGGEEEQRDRNATLLGCLALLIIAAVVIIYTTMKPQSNEDAAWDHFASQPREIRENIIALCRDAQVGGYDAVLRNSRETGTDPVVFMRTCTFLRERGAY